MFCGQTLNDPKIAKFASCIHDTSHYFSKQYGKNVLLSKQSWPIPAVFLMFGCGKLIQLCFRSSIKLTWMDEYLTDMLVMGSLMGCLRLAYYYCKHCSRTQFAIFVIESVSQQQPPLVHDNRLLFMAVVITPVLLSAMLW